MHLGQKKKKKTLFLTFESDQMFELKALFVHREVDDLNSSLEACETLAAIFSPIIQLFCSYHDFTLSPPATRLMLRERKVVSEAPLVGSAGGLVLP